MSEPTAIDSLHQALDQAPTDANLHQQLAKAYKDDKQITRAIYHYQQALAITPQDAPTHNNLAMLYAGNNQYSQALQHYREAVQCNPTLLPAHFNLGLLLLQRQELAAAEKQFANVLALHDAHPAAHFYLATLHLHAGRIDEAQTLFERLVTLDPEHTDGWVNLGVVALQRGQHQQAVDYFTRALVLDNDHVEARNNLAATFIHADRYAAAAEYYEGLLRDYPNSVEYLYNNGVAQMGLGHIQKAESLFQEVLRCETKHFGALSNCAVLCLRKGDRSTAGALLERALEVAPDDQTTRFMHAALHHRPVASCPQYAHDLFNHYALYYDKHMTEQLQYAVPQRLWSLLHAGARRNFPQVLDLGCGTGLCGMVLRPFAQELTGVDLAPKMLAVARDKALYDVLLEAEALAFLQDKAIAYDLIVAADVLPYFGALDALFQAVRLRMTTDALFWVTTEISHDAPWRLQDSMRFCHQLAYIQSLCHQNGLVIVHQETMVARQQDHHPLSVYLLGIALAVSR